MEQNNNVVEPKDEVIVTVEKKEGVMSKIGNGAKKVFSSKPAKIVGGILLAAGGAVVGYSVANKKSNDCYDEDFEEEFYDDDEFEPAEEIPDEQVND